MHAAPSVSYPVGRSAFAGALAAAIVFAGFAAALYWSLQATTYGWRQSLAFAAVLACGTLAAIAWRRSPQGTLHWDGLEWSWEQGASRRSGQPELALDLQARMLLRWRGVDRVTRWFWVERESDVSHWDALRRAVYSRASPPAPVAGEPPAAEQ